MKHIYILNLLTYKWNKNNEAEHNCLKDKIINIYTYIVSLNVYIPDLI